MISSVLRGLPWELQAKRKGGVGRFDHLKTDTAKKPFGAVLSIYLPPKVKNHLIIAHQSKAGYDDAVPIHIIVCMLFLNLSFSECP